MGLGSVQNSPHLLMVGVKMMLDDGGHVEEDRGLSPPAEKYARYCHPLHPLPPNTPHSDSGGSDHTAVLDVSHPCQGPRDSGAYSLDMEGCSDSPEGSNLSGSECGGSVGGRNSAAGDVKPCVGTGISAGGRAGSVIRKQREFTPEEHKDELYWEKRRKNNEAARKSREKRRMHDMLLENRIVDLEEANSRLREELHSLKKRYGLPLDTSFMDQHRADGVHDSSSPPLVPSHPALSGGRVTSGLTPYSNPPSLPPPLIVMSEGAVPEMSMQQMSVRGMFPSQAAHLPFLLNGLPPNLHLLPAKHHVMAQSMLAPQAHQHNGVVMAKREPEEDKLGVQIPTLRQENYQEHSSQDCPVTFQPYPSGSPPSLPLLIAPTLPAHCVGADTVPSGLTNGRSTPSVWRTSPLSSHSSDDAWDQPLQLTVHKRCSEEERVDGDRGRELVSVCEEDSKKQIIRGHAGDSRKEVIKGHHHHNTGSSSPPSSLPLKLRHKIPSAMSPPHTSHPGALYSTTQGSSIIQESPETLETDVTQTCPLPLIKTEPNFHSEESGREDFNTVTHPKHTDPKYLERRKRNNEAARKCRENRRKLTREKEVKSGYLALENSRLRVELDCLQQEMSRLRELLDKKREERGQGASHQQLVLSEEQRQQLQQLEEEHRLLKEEQRRLEQKQKQQRHKYNVLHDYVDDNFDDSGDTN